MMGDLRTKGYGEGSILSGTQHQASRPSTTSTARRRLDDTERVARVYEATGAAHGRLADPHGPYEHTSDLRFISPKNRGGEYSCPKHGILMTALWLSVTNSPAKRKKGDLLCSGIVMSIQKARCRSKIHSIQTQADSFWSLESLDFAILRHQKLGYRALHIDFSSSFPLQYDVP